VKQQMKWPMAAQSWLLVVLVYIGSPFTLFLARGAQLGQERPPNFILIFTDDVGFGDLACYGHPYARTPNIDRLAKEGTLFRQFHVNGNICPVTRSGLLTSRSPAWFPNYPEEFGFLGTPTVMKVLQEGANYTTGHIGKWNIGPDPSGERIEYGIDYLRVMGGSPVDDEQGREHPRIEEAMTFVEQSQDRPFYLNLWLMALHTPISPPQSFLDQFADLIVNRADFGEHMQTQSFDRLDALGKDIDETMRGYLADLLALDGQVGRLLDQLDELNLADNTVVVFSSDNGPADVEKAPKSLGYAGGLRGGKHTYYEGGTRVPFLVRWPGHVPAGRVDDDSVMSGLDWLTTVSSIAGASYPADRVEGEDMSDVWRGARRSRTAPLFFREIAKDGPAYVRYGRWKWHDQTRELYDLATDPFEERNVAAIMPDVVVELSQLIDDWLATLPSEYARKEDGRPVQFDPNAPVQKVTLPNLAGNAFPLSDKSYMPSAANNNSTDGNVDSITSTMLTVWISTVLALLQFCW
jgi:arylsulfatase A-like enzyme